MRALISFCCTIVPVCLLFTQANPVEAVCDGSFNLSIRNCINLENRRAEEARRQEQLRRQSELRNQQQMYERQRQQQMYERQRQQQEYSRKRR